MSNAKKEAGTNRPDPLRSIPPPTGCGQAALEDKWAAIGALYRQPLVAQTVLGAEEAAKLDVTLFLFLCVECAARTDQPTLDRLLHLSRQWQEAVLHPLRAARHGAKSLYAETFQTLKAAELEAEKAALSAYMDGASGPVRVADYLARLPELNPALKAQLMALAGPASGMS